ncbi:MAG: DEAD/DEAH box helicase [Pseudomonadota bacterium]
MLTELELDHRLRLGLDALGLVEPTPVQIETVPAALAGRDVLVCAPTGSGKTLSFLLPIANKILASNHHLTSGTLALVLVPTRELARQVVKQGRSLLTKTPLRIQAITGGADFKYQKALLRKDPEILVATPGRLREHCAERSAHLDAVQWLVMDEADRMLDLGLREDVLLLAGHCNARPQVMLLSATLKHRGVSAIAGSLLSDPVRVSIGSARAANPSITHQRILADSREHKDKLLVSLIAEHDSARVLVFANKRRTVDRLRGVMLEHGLKCAALHGEMRTEQRKHVVEQFQSNKVQVLCASDVAARGLDIAGIDVVINYDLPRSGDDYVHRSGRTGRAGKQGLTVSMVDSSEWNLMISIQRYLSLAFESRSLTGLKARYKGPKQQKNSGKAAGRKSSRKPDKNKQKTTKRPNRRKTTASKTPPSAGSGNTQPRKTEPNDGFAPLTRRRTKD